MAFRMTMSILTTLAAIALAWGVPAATSASTTGGIALLQLADGNQRFSISGTVAWVNYASNTVGVNAGGQNVEVVMTPATVIEVHGQSGSIADIRHGKKISASGVVRDGKKVALSIVLK